MDPMDAWYEELRKQMESDLRNANAFGNRNFSGSFRFDMKDKVTVDGEERLMPSNLQVRVDVIMEPVVQMAPFAYNGNAGKGSDTGDLSIKVIARFYVSEHCVRMKTWATIMPTRESYIEDMFKRHVFFAFAAKPKVEDFGSYRLSWSPSDKPTVAMTERAIQFFKRLVS